MAKRIRCHVQGNSCTDYIYFSSAKLCAGGHQNGTPEYVWHAEHVVDACLWHTHQVVWQRNTPGVSAYIRGGLAMLELALSGSGTAWAWGSVGSILIPETTTGSFLKTFSQNWCLWHVGLTGETIAAHYNHVNHRTMKTVKGTEPHAQCLKCDSSARNLNRMKKVTQKGSAVIWCHRSGISNSMISVSTTDLLLKMTITESFRLEGMTWDHLVQPLSARTSCPGPSWVLSMSTDGDSVTSLGNLFQCLKLLCQNGSGHLISIFILFLWGEKKKVEKKKVSSSCSPL